MLKWCYQLLFGKPRFEITWLFQKHTTQKLCLQYQNLRADDFKSKAQEVAWPPEKRLSFGTTVAGHNFHSLPRKTGLFPCRFSVLCMQTEAGFADSCEHWSWFIKVSRLSVWYFVGAEYTEIAFYSIISRIWFMYASQPRHIQLVVKLLTEWFLWNSQFKINSCISHSVSVSLHYQMKCKLIKY